MLIQEIENRTDEKGNAFVHLSIDGKEYLILGGALSKSVTVACGRWIDDMRSIGKTFFSLESLRVHYKRHGNELARYAERMF